MFDQRFERRQKLGPERAIDHPMIARQRNRHPADEPESIRRLDRPPFAGADR
jgi:hypothetical protein